MTLETQAAFAKRRGVGKSAVTNWKNSGLLVMEPGAGGKLLVNVEASNGVLDARIDPMRGRPSGGEQEAAASAPVAPDADPAPGRRVLADARAELVDEDLFGRRLKNASTAGELVPLMESERRLSEIGRLVRERFGAELRSVAERLAATSDVRGIMAIQDEAIAKASSALADAIAGGLLDEDEEEEAEETVAAAA